MADTSVAGDSVKNGSNNVEKSDNFEVPSGLTNKGNTETNETDEKMDESSAPFLKSVNKVVIPKDKSLYPGFPSMSKEDSDAAIIGFWKVWRKQKYKQKEKAKKLAKKLENDDNDPEAKQKEQKRRSQGKMQRGRGRGKPDSGAPKSNYGGGSFNYGGGGYSGNGNGAGNFGQGFGSNPDWLSQQNSGYSGQNTYDSYGAAGYDQSGGYNQSYNMDYSNQGSYNNYSNDYSEYNSQPQFGRGFNRPAGGQRGGRDGGRDGRRSEQSRDRRRSDQVRPKGGPLDPRGKRPEKRSKKPSESRESKPAPVVKILAQLKECPFGVNVYQSHNKKLPITEKEFTEIMSTINQNWMVEMDTSEEKLKVEGSEWYKNRGIILCQDEFSRKWVQKSMETIEVGGRQFKAWAVGEFGDVVDVSVFLGSALDSCPDPKDVIVKALKNSEVEFEKVEVVNVTKNDKGRLVNLLMDGKCINTLKFKKNGKIFAGLAELKFEF